MLQYSDRSEFLIQTDEHSKAAQPVRNFMADTCFDHRTMIDSSGEGQLNQIKYPIQHRLRHPCNWQIEMNMCGHFVSDQTQLFDLAISTTLHIYMK